MSGYSTSGSSGLFPWQFNVANYGAIPSPTVDATPGIRAAQAAAVSYALANESRSADIVYPGGTYYLSSPVVTGGTTLGNAQIPLPIVDGANRKITLAHRALASSAAVLPHWNQTVSQRWPVTLKSTLTGQVVDATYGAPSILGGPTPGGGYGSGTGVFNNVCVIVDGIGFQTPWNPTLSAMDFRGMAECYVDNVAAIVDSVPSFMVGNPPTNSWATGLLLPQNFNNDLLYVGNFSCEGFYLGFSIGEHAVIQRAACIYCHDAVFIQADSANIHGSSIQELSVEVCTNGLTTSGGGPNNCSIFINSMSCESVTTHINDPTNNLAGKVNFVALPGVLPTVTGGGNLEIIAGRQTRGSVTAPGIPASGTPLINPFWRHAGIRVIGGTVSAIAIDGVNTGATSGAFVVPSGNTITLTYTVAPTWSWFLM